MKKRRVVVTGLGAITPIGNNVADFWNGLLSGKNGVDLITKFNTDTSVTKFAAEVKDFDPTIYIDKKSLRRVDLFTIYAIGAAEQAIADSGIDLEKVDRTRFGVVHGSGIGGIKTFQEQTNQYLTNNTPKALSPFFVTMMIADIAAGQISIRHGLKGPNYSTTSACASASHAISDAFMLIQRGNADVMVCGGSEAPVTDLSIAGFNALRALSENNEDYKHASRPFDVNRDGFVMGEGSGILIIEELEHALARGANIYAELSGVGVTADAYHITAPDPTGDGAARAMAEAVRDAGLDVSDVDYINAHGTSTPYNDVTETQAIKAVFGNHAYNLTVSSIKSMTGHLLGAAGGIEAIATVLSVKNNKIPPTINTTELDPKCDLDYSVNKVTEREVNVAISNTFGFGGHNASLLFTKYKD